MWYALQSGGYYDFRGEVSRTAHHEMQLTIFLDAQDAWIRIPFVAENLYICPAGSFHRYITIDDNNVRAKILRLVKGDPGWRYIEREEAEQLPLRAEYLKSIGVGA
ncbi:hypothetical protein MPER_01262 [Moniliophthora perniciosa FA553]|nr:hypothetical protein MPER_01262 [Moniliophthora perniciosa FA553]